MKKFVALLLVFCMIIPTVGVFAKEETIKVKVTNTGSVTGYKRLVLDALVFPFEITSADQLKGSLLNGTVTYSGSGNFSKSVLFKDVVIEKSDVRDGGKKTAIDFKIPEGYTIDPDNAGDKFYVYDLTLTYKEGAGGTTENTAPKPVEKPAETPLQGDVEMKLKDGEWLMFLKAENFTDLGTWNNVGNKNNSTFPILEGFFNSTSGEAKPANATVSVPKDVKYAVWARSLDFKENQPATRFFSVAVNDEIMPTDGGTHKTEGWAWQKLGEIELKSGEVKVSLIDSSNFYARCELIALTSDLNFVPPTGKFMIDAVNKYSNGEKAEIVAPTNKLGKAVALYLGSSKAYVLGKETSIDADNKEVVPFTENDRTLVPVRFIAESFGAKVDWDDKTQTVTATINKKVVKMVLGETKMTVDGVEVTLDTPANTYNDRTFIPLRAMVEAIGKNVFWDDRGLILISDLAFDATADKDLIDDIILGFGGKIIDFAIVDEDLSAYQGTIGENDYKLDYFNPYELQERDGLANVIGKLKKGGDVTIGFLGGSITMQDGWRGKTLEWLRAQYKDANIIEVDVSLSGTGSALAACRTDNEIIAFNPDLVFVEYAVNGGTQQEMEGIVRKIWDYDPMCDICFVYTTTVNTLDSYSNALPTRTVKDFETVADYYGIPSIAFGYQIAELNTQGKLTLKGTTPEPGKILFSNDGVHPTMDGSILYAGAVVRGIATMDKHATNDSFPRTLKAPLNNDNWENAKSIDDWSKMKFEGEWFDCSVDENNNFKNFEYTGGYLDAFKKLYPKLQGTKKAGSSVTVKFKGTKVGVFEAGGQFSGQLKVVVDGKELPDKLVLYNNNDSKLRHQYYFIPDLEDGVHEVTFILDETMPDKSYLKNANPSDNLYDRNEFYLGKILLLGEILDINE